MKENQKNQKHIIFCAAFLFCQSFLFLGTANASDHIDGPATTKHAITDLSDFYAFPTPGKQGYLTLIVNTHPMATKSNHFSEKVNYNFILREASVNFETKGFDTPEASEKIVTCSFKTPHNHSKHTMTCRVQGTEIMQTVPFNKAITEFDESGIRTYAGLRSDPFFFNADWAKSVSVMGKLIDPIKENTMDKMNALSVMVEVNLEDLFGPSASMVAIAVESTTLDKGAKEPRRLDRIGRPEVTNVTMVPHAAGEDHRDQYNLDKPFHVSKKNQAIYRTHILKNIKFYDNIDQSQDWDNARSIAYTEIILQDFLVVDISKDSSGEGYFTIEAALLNGEEHATSGGRMPSDDIMDRLFSILITGDRDADISDGVNNPYRAVSNVFPYLAKPDNSWSARLKAWAARKVLGS